MNIRMNHRFRTPEHKKHPLHLSATGVSYSYHNANRQVLPLLSPQEMSGFGPIRLRGFVIHRESEGQGLTPQSLIAACTTAVWGEDRRRLFP